MGELDKAIEYNTKLAEVKDILKKIGKLGIKSTSYLNKVKEIENETAVKINVSYDTFCTSESNTFLVDSLNHNYSKALQQLDKIYNYVCSLYEVYYVLDSDYKSLRKKVDEVNQNNFMEIASKIKDLLVVLKFSGTVKYDEEKKFVDNIYALVYRMIKIELLYGSRSLFDYIKSDETDMLFIAALIKKDADKMIRNGENASLTNKLLELEKKGLSNRFYFDEDLLMILIAENSEVFDKVKKEFLVKYEEYDKASKDLMEVRSGKDDLSKTIQNNRVRLRNINLKKFGKNMLFALDIAAVCGAIYVTTDLAKALSTTTTYKTVTTFYDSTHAEVEENVIYADSVDDSLSLVEYSPWEEPGYFREGYTRNVYTYDLSNLEETYNSIKDYLHSDLKEYVTFDEEIETVEEKPEDIYEGNKYVIERVMQDKTDSQIQINQGNFNDLKTLFGTFLSGFDFLLLFWINKKLQLRKKKKECKKTFIANKEKFLELEMQIAHLLDTLNEMRKGIYQYYDQLPNILKEDGDIKKKLLLLEDEKKNNGEML